MSEQIPGTVAVAIDGVIVANPVTVINFVNAKLTPRGGGVIDVEFIPVVGPSGPQGATGPEGPTGPQPPGVPWAGDKPNGTTIEAQEGVWVAKTP